MFSKDDNKQQVSAKKAEEEEAAKKAEEEEAAKKAEEEEAAKKAAAEYQNRARNAHDSELDKRKAAKKAAKKPDGVVVEGKALVTGAKVYAEGDLVYKDKIGPEVFDRHKKLGTIK